MNSVLPTIIIPAHNEQSNIAETLDNLEAREQQAFNIMVVCNGCTDNTADIVRNKYPSVYCEEIDMASKALAIRHAESKKPGFPRVYMDADIGLSASAIKKLLKAAGASNQAKLVIPVARINMDNSGYWVKAYYSVWRQSPYVKKQGYGSGVYVLNQSARYQFGEWPELIADDGYVRLYFATDDIEIISEAIAAVKAPKTLRHLIRIKTRSKYGALELKSHIQQRQDFQPSQHAFGHAWLSKLALGHPIKVAVYILINLITSFRAKRYSTNKPFFWLRDESTR